MRAHRLVNGPLDGFYFSEHEFLQGKIKLPQLPEGCQEIFAKLQGQVLEVLYRNRTYLYTRNKHVLGHNKKAFLYRYIGMAPVDGRK